MQFPLREKIDYVKDRCLNAIWMFRNGKFKLIVKSVHIEINHRVMLLKSLLLHGRNPDYSKLPGSAYVNRRKLVPASYAPTKARRSSLPVLQVDRKKVTDELNAIIASSVIGDNSQS